MDKIDRLLVIGDIHGKWDRFWNLYQKVGFNPEHDLMVSIRTAQSHTIAC